MKQATVLTNALLWAAAIIAAAAVGAPAFLSLILLPSLGAMSTLVSWQGHRVNPCASLGGTRP